MHRYRLILTGILVAGAVYFVLVPAIVWRLAPPSVATGIPNTWPHNQDIPLDVRISSCHSSYAVTRVQLFLDPLESKIRGLKDPLESIVLLDREEPGTWNLLTLNRFTFPRRETMRLPVPLAELAAKGKIGPGTIVGSLDVTIATPSIRLRRRYRATKARNAPVIVLRRIPFRMELQ